MTGQITNLQILEKMTKIKKPAELTITPMLKVLLYGQPGIGKTTLALSFPDPLLIDCDRGTHRVKPEHMKDTVEVNSWSDVDEVLNEDLRPYKTIVFDTGGKLIDYMTDHLIKVNPKFAQTDGTFSLKGYGARKVMFQTLLSRLHIMGKHVVFVAHEKEEKDGDNRFIRPEIGGSSGNDLIKELDMVAYMDAVGNKRTLHLAPQERYYAKNSLGLDEALHVPDVEKGNTFMTGIVEQYLDNVNQRREQSKRYFEVLGGIEEKITAVTGCDEANAFIQEVHEMEHIWDTKLRAASMLRTKAGELGLEFDRESAKYVQGEKPQAEPPSEPQAEPETPAKSPEVIEPKKKSETKKKRSNAKSEK